MKNTITLEDEELELIISLIRVHNADAALRLNRYKFVVEDRAKDDTTRIAISNSLLIGKSILTRLNKK